MNVRVVEEANDFVYKDQEEVWNSLWTHGARGALNKLDDRAMESFRADFEVQMKTIQEADGVHIQFHMLYGLGTRK